VLNAGEAEQTKRAPCMRGILFISLRAESEAGVVAHDDRWREPPPDDFIVLP
jgi:hypothetical protein